MRLIVFVQVFSTNMVSLRGFMLIPAELGGIRPFSITAFHTVAGQAMRIVVFVQVFSTNMDSSTGPHIHSCRISRHGAFSVITTAFPGFLIHD